MALQENLSALFNVMKLNENVQSHFHDATIRYNHLDRTKNNLFTLIIELPQLLDVYVAEQIMDAIPNFPYPLEISMVLNDSASVDTIAVQTYYYLFLNRYFKDAAMGKTLRVVQWESLGSHVQALIDGQLIEDAFRKLLPELSTFFKQWGVAQGIEIKSITDRSKTQEMLAKIEEEKIADEQRRLLEYQEAPLTDIPVQKKFKPRKAIAIKMSDIEGETNDIIVEGYIFKIDVVPIRKLNSSIYTFAFSDYTASIVMKVFEGKKFEKAFLEGLKVNQWVRVRGTVEYDNYSRSNVLKPNTIDVIEAPAPRMDSADQKRVELHLHSKMSAMDAVTSIEDYIKIAKLWGHEAIAVTDHGVIQAFPDAQEAAAKSKIKMIYGMEAYVVDTKLHPIFNPSRVSLTDSTYVFFDLETTGLSPRYDEIIEFGAVKYKNRREVDRLQLLIKPTVGLSKVTIKLTGLTDLDLVKAPAIHEVIDKISSFFGDSILVAHNAIFDVGMMNAALLKLGKPALTNPVIDTLPVMRMMQKGLKAYSLGGLSRFYSIPYNDADAHRAVYDADVLAKIFDAMLGTLQEKHGCKTHQDLNGLPEVDPTELPRPTHMTLWVKNQTGLKNLYRLVSESHLRYFKDVPIIPKSLLADNREGLLIGSGCLNGEIYDLAQTGTEQELVEAMRFFDYIEVQPTANFAHLIARESIETLKVIERTTADIVASAALAGKKVIATGDVHYAHPVDKIYRDVYIHAQAKGQKRHPLRDYEGKVKTGPDQHFRTTNEMMDEFAFLGKSKAEEIVITNTQLLSKEIEVLNPISNELHTPHIEGVDDTLEKMCFDNARQWYGEVLPEIVEKRLVKELTAIKHHRFSVIYYIAHRLVKNSLDEGYLVGSRGSVGSSFVATCALITEVNPLAPHYRCTKCKHSQFFDDGSVASGFDLPDIPCPHCGTIMRGDGQNIPFETFLGFKGEKVPDIDLNFSSEYQARAHAFTKELLGENNVYRAGTISKVQEKTAYGYVRNYYESMGIMEPLEAEIRRLAIGCSDVKRTTGQHPGGIVVIPGHMDVLDFTPVQYPADEADSTWKTTHFEYKRLHDSILKLDILGHVDPTALRMLFDMTGIDPQGLPMNDPQVMSLFADTSSMHVTSDQIMSLTGAIGIPEFGTSFVRGMLELTTPSKFSELVQISGLSHGTDVWLGNAQDLIKDKTCTLMNVIGCRDDIMVYLSYRGIEPSTAFKIMEDVRKGKGVKAEYETIMLEHKVPQWYIDSCRKIQYMFPKAHAVAYVMMALRVGWYKIYRPLEYYAVYFSVRVDAYDIETMVKGKDIIREKLEILQNRLEKRDEMTNKEKDLITTLEAALEMTARGYRFAPISLSRSLATKFDVDHETQSIIPPFTTIDGLGGSAAQKLVANRDEAPFRSREDFAKRSGVNQTHLKTLEKMGVLNELASSDQLTLF